MSGKFSPYTPCLQAIVDSRPLQVLNPHSGKWYPLDHDDALCAMVNGSIEAHRMRPEPPRIEFNGGTIPRPKFGIPGVGTPVYFATSEGCLVEKWSGVLRQLDMRRCGLMHWAPKDAEEHSQALRKLRASCE